MAAILKKKYQTSDPYGLIPEGQRIKKMPFAKFFDEPFPRNRVLKLTAFSLHSYVVMEIVKKSKTQFFRFSASDAFHIRPSQKWY